MLCNLNETPFQQNQSQKAFSPSGLCLARYRTVFSHKTLLGRERTKLVSKLRRHPLICSIFLPVAPLPSGEGFGVRAISTSLARRNLHLVILWLLSLSKHRMQPLVFPLFSCRGLSYCIDKEKSRQNIFFDLTQEENQDKTPLKIGTSK